MRKQLQVLAFAAIFGAGGVRADSTLETDPILDRAIAALGGEAKLKAAKAISVKAKGTINFGGNENPFSSEFVSAGIDKCRQTFETEFGGNKVKGKTVVAASKGWRIFGDMDSELEGEQLDNEKRNLYLRVVPFTVLPLKGKEFKLKLGTEEKIDGKPAACIEGKGPDGKDFKIWFDKDTGLPAKLAAKTPGFMGDEAEQIALYTNYKEMGGVKVAGKRKTSRDGEKFIEEDVTDFQLLSEIPAKAFDKPE